ncbi:MAG: chlorophyll synthesis pathway protein BchC [Pseudomonadota bacterium]
MVVTLAEPSREFTGPQSKGARQTQADAIVLHGDRQAHLEPLALKSPAAGDVIVKTIWSGVSTGTERLFWSGEMPPFPGMGYPLVPGYEAVGRVVESDSPSHKPGDLVFVPGANCYENASGLFGASASTLIVPGHRATRIDGDEDPSWSLLALAATAHHAIERGGTPELIIGHGVLGRLAARLTLALDGPPPTVWEIRPERMDAQDYAILDPRDDPRMDYRTIMDLSGDSRVIDTAIAHGQKRVSVTLAGFYHDRPSFNFPPAFIKEATLHVAAEWTEADLAGVLDLVRRGQLSLGGLITHIDTPDNADTAYRTAFEDPACLKLILDWRQRP